ncbi:hypothetical protein BS47DRAFT_1360304 [Hydnum rufescens UP504]|uniref:Uncharacterized protein n=1 Tax=Hydnum rufescens UP504 TaxID=1448309 RepID=A0A9P6B529_9AGAM|nr:hypothetical protein BS47DRAFT_1360304 [Hydnum rufescens UP504]
MCTDHVEASLWASHVHHMVWQKGFGLLSGLDTVTVVRYPARTSHGLLYWLRFNAQHLTIAGGHVISDISTLSGPLMSFAYPYDVSTCTYISVHIDRVGDRIRGSTVGEGYADCLDIRLVAIKGLGLRSGVFYFIFWEVKMSQYEQPEQNVRSLMLTMAPEGGDRAGAPCLLVITNIPYTGDSTLWELHQSGQDELVVWCVTFVMDWFERAGLGLEGIYMAAFRVEVIVEVAYSSPNDVRRHIGGYSLCLLARGYRGGRLCHIYEAAHKQLSDLDAVWVKLNLSTLGTSPPASWCWPMYLGLPVAPPAVNSAIWPTCEGRMYVVPLVGSDGLAELEIVGARRADVDHSVEPPEHVVKKRKAFHVEPSHWVCSHQSAVTGGAEQFWAGFNHVYWCQPTHFYNLDPILIIDS